MNPTFRHIVISHIKEWPDLITQKQFIELTEKAVKEDKRLWIKASTLRVRIRKDAFVVRENKTGMLKNLKDSPYFNDKMDIVPPKFPGFACR